ncbi:MAG: hypothetical protein JRJ42_10650 [Deltaproteobacteria bacterium]|nr:hypothetical protein [Deltaproteobacteria bacterium]MBW2020957.1 hypothetical protein [Deltaproteobacteria bacterium]
MNILGVHIGHDSSAALVCNGKIVADMAEERFTRIKHYAGFPSSAIQACLDIAELSITDIDVIAIPTVGIREELNYFFELKGTQRECEIRGERVEGSVQRLRGMGWEKPPLYMKRFPVSTSTEIVHVDHHLAHAASAYYTCGSEDPQLIVTMDGVGDNGTSVAIWRGESGKITLLKQFDKSGSLGWFYGIVTEALGWRHGDGEGKTMGLAPYGDPDEAKGALYPFCPKFSNGDLIESHDFGIPYSWNDKGAYHWHFEEAGQIRSLIEKYGREHIAAEAQRVLEDQVAAIIFPWMEREGLKNLCCAGGVFLNVKLNQRIWESGKVAHHHIYPNAGDSGLAVGAALYVHHEANTDGGIISLESLYLGPEFTNEEIQRFLDARHLRYRFEEDVASVTARLLANGKIVGWIEGRMESGPRALGGRSILMSPTSTENKDIINAQVKFREPFRPFCPSILAEYMEDYLVRCRPERFMITSFDVKPERREAIPAVVHVDGTLRPQTIDRAINPLYWKLIKTFGDLTGEYVLLNTSFNIRGEPIICHPREAIRCFYDTGMEHLVIGNYILSK